MSEFPSAKPTTDISWGESSTNVTPPLSGQRASGWLVGQDHPSDVENSLRREAARHLSHVESIALRSFDNLNEAVEETLPGDLFRTHPSEAAAWSDRYDMESDSGSSAGCGFVQTDGKYLFFCEGNVVYCFKNVNGGDSANQVWTVNLASTISLSIQPNGVYHSHCGAKSVAFCGVNTLGNAFVVWLDAETGAVLYSAVNDTAYDYYSSVRCDANASGERVLYWVGKHTAGTNFDVFRHRYLTGTDLFISSGTSSLIHSIAVTADHIFELSQYSVSSNLYTINVYNKSDGSLLGQRYAFGDASGHGSQLAKMETDGKFLYVLANPPGAGDYLTLSCFPILGTYQLPGSGDGYYNDFPEGNGAGLSFSNNETSRIWRRTLIDTGALGHNLLDICVDHKYVYGIFDGTFMAFDKRYGSLVYFDSGWGATTRKCVSSDGHKIWTNTTASTGSVTSAIMSAVVMPNQGQLWLRRGNGIDSADNNRNYYKTGIPFNKLTIPLAWA